MMRVLLLNPPGDRPYLRDYYCSHSAKGYYYWHPYDLVVQSGILAQHHDVLYLDANAYGYSFEKAASIIAGMQPEAILFLTGGVCWKQDLQFLENLNIPRSVPVIGTGDVMVSKGREIMSRYDWLSGILLDFTSHIVLEFLSAWDSKRGCTHLNGAQLPNFLYRAGDEYVRGVNTSERYYQFPLPRYDLIPHHKYSIPHGRRRRFASFLTDFGCPYTCSFCFNGKWDHKLRNLDNAMQELRYIKKLGIRELWIKDLTFGVNRHHSMEFLNRMIDEKLNFDWVTLSRVDVMDEELLSLMSRAGCHTIQFGVESADQAILDSIEKGIEPARVLELFKLCRRLNIRTLAHFIIGLPGETQETALQTIEFSKELNPDFASFNVAAPRMGTDMRTDAIRQGWTSSKIDTIDNSIAFPQMDIGTLTPQEILDLRTKAIREFHLRPSYLWHKFMDIRSPIEGWRMLQNGYTLLKSTLHQPTQKEILEGDM